MKKKQFEKKINELFSGTLSGEGFSNEKSKHCTFYRQISEKVFHVIIPDQGTRGEWYDVKVFPTSPLLQPNFEKMFPDDLIVPTGSYGYLDPQDGVDAYQYSYDCTSEENLVSDFEATLKPALLNHAVPYLNKFSTIEEIVPYLKSKVALGAALIEIGKQEEGKLLLQEEQKRLNDITRKDETIDRYLAFIDEKLKK